MARLQYVYDRVRRDVLRSGQARDAREVEEVLVARLRWAFPDGPDTIPRSKEDRRRDLEHLARGKRIML